ncbi:hypothetical protein HJG60_009369 [Phyllostomus discolor]|uniref:Uncharacterized protein n=1 Tax=Phyllostomus discolor TaxID=89673 RepID=A0A834DCF7_9CHIR|nr:hypothetical protein HJG60_009369 [Phyllostomus discolor]
MSSSGQPRLLCTPTHQLPPTLPTHSEANSRCHIISAVSISEIAPSVWPIKPTLQGKYPSFLSPSCCEHLASACFCAPGAVPWVRQVQGSADVCPSPPLRGRGQAESALPCAYRCQLSGVSRAAARQPT